METKSNYVMVGAITLLLLALLAAFTIWLSRAGEGSKKEYDIFFQQSVSGLAKGSSVAFSGVPVGEVASIDLWEPDPDFVRVRIKIKEEVPILLGTVALKRGRTMSTRVLAFIGAIVVYAWIVSVALTKNAGGFLTVLAA